MSFLLAIRQLLYGDLMKLHQIATICLQMIPAITETSLYPDGQVHPPTCYAGRLGRFFRQNIINPTSEKTHLVTTNDGSFFSDLGEKIVVGGWINPTTYSVGQTYIPIFNTRQGPGQPIFYVSLFQGKTTINAV